MKFFDRIPDIPPQLPSWVFVAIVVIGAVLVLSACHAVGVL